MHFEILVEDASGKLLLEELLPKILGPDGEPHTYRILAYKGIGKIPKGLTPASEPRKRILLDQLPRLLRGYGKSLAGQDAAVVVVVDKDRNDCRELKADLLAVKDACNPAPTTLFRIAIEEIEAWLLGDRAAIARAYKKAKTNVLNRYVQDSTCGTWELLADAIHPGGAKALQKAGWPAPGIAKCDWARKVGPEMDVDANVSKSFQVFRDGLRRLTGVTPAR
jgi:hypothetical protein